MGEVYRATDTNLKRQVAIKVLPASVAADADRLTRFQREAEVLAALNHPHIAHLYALEKSGGTLALVMELIEGPTLADRIARGPIPLADALPIAKQIAEALQAAHEHGIIHRDLKPANIKVREDGTVKVLDFGLAKAMESTGASRASASMSPTITTPAMTQAGIILGTAAYMSPEQGKGRAVDKRSDLWAFGAVLYEMLTGQRAFGGDDVSDTLAQVLMKEPNWAALPSPTPAPIRRLLRRCLEKDRQRRLPDAVDIGLEIEDALAGPGAEAQPTGAGLTAPRRRRWGWLAAGVAVGLLVASTAAFFSLRRPDDTTRIRLSVIMPGPSGSPSVSPDGRRLAFVAPGGLFVRALDAGDARVLPGTEGADGPFWSPDSRSLGFVAQGTLKRIEVSGGPPQTLCDVMNFAGGTWNADGVVLFSNQVVLKRLPASGGKPTDVTTLSANELGHWHPSFLPDGRHVLFLKVAKPLSESTIQMGSLDSTARVDVVKAYSNVAYAPPGYLLFPRNGTLMAQPFDAQRLSLRGEPMPVADHVVDYASSTPTFAVSNTGVLVYREARQGAVSPSHLTWYDRTGTPLGSVGTPGAYSDPALSPDGTRIAVHQHQEPSGGDIWVLDRDRGTFARVTFDASHNSGPRWSPDGRTIAFASDRDGIYQIYQKSSSGVGPDELVLKSGDWNWPQDWAPDGQAMLFGTLTPKTQADIWLLPLRGERTPKPVVTTEFSELGATFSPDGRWIAYHSDESGQDDEVYVHPYPQRTSKWQISTHGGRWPRWAKNGKELLYVTGEGAMMTVDVKLDGPAFQAGTPRTLFKKPAMVMVHGEIVSDPYDVTADGQRFLVNERVANEGVSAASPTSFTVVLNWPAALKK